MRNLLLVLTLFVPIYLNAQDKPCPCNSELGVAFEAQLKGSAYKGMPDLVGEEFFNKEYTAGDIYLEDGQVSYDQKIRYNGRIDGLLMLPQNHLREIALDKIFIKGFSLKNIAGNGSLYFKKIKVAGVLKNDSVEIFGQELYRGKMSLYVHRRYVFENEVEQYLGERRVFRRLFVPSYVYYFKLPNNTSIGFISFRKKQLYKLFPSDKEMMKRLFREKHQHKFKTEEDIIAITEILNEMFNK